MSDKPGITIRLEGDLFDLFLEIRGILKDILGLEEEPTPELTMAMIFQYAKALFCNAIEGFNEIRFVNNNREQEKVGDLIKMIRKDWAFFQLQRMQFDTMQ